MKLRQSDIMLRQLNLQTEVFMIETPILQEFHYISVINVVLLITLSESVRIFNSGVTEGWC